MPARFVLRERYDAQKTPAGGSPNVHGDGRTCRLPAQRHPRDDVILSPQTVQVKGENGDLVITRAGDVTFNGKQYNLNAAQREQAKIIRRRCVAACRGSTKVPERA